MKKTLFLAAAAALVLAGCGRAGTYDRTEVTEGYKVDYPGFGAYALINIWTDPETGCDHYVTDDGFMSPRMLPSGQQLCRGGSLTQGLVVPGAAPLPRQAGPGVDAPAD